jgi:hypothetical protein
MLSLANTSFSNTLLPNLKNFECWCKFNIDFPVLLAFLRLRWEDRESPSNDVEPRNLVRLESVKFQTTANGMPDAQMLVQLRQLAKEGMALRLSTADGSWV